jgi:RNA polymerase sigma factor (sigma-70 family)
MDQAQTRDLIIRAQAGDSRAEGLLIEANMGLAIWFAGQWRKSSRYANLIERDQVTQCCLIGLMNAIRKYDLTRNVTFATVAPWWMRCELSDQVRREAKWLLRHKQRPSTQAPTYTESFDSVVSDNACRLDDALPLFTSAERDLLRDRYGLDGKAPRSFAAIAAERGCTPTELVQLEQAAMKRVRLSLEFFPSESPMSA